MENQTQLTIVDLSNAHQLLDLAATRGAFRAAEMQQVGELYNKLTAFLNAVAKQQKAEQQASGEQASDQEPAPESQGEENA